MLNKENDLGEAQIAVDEVQKSLVLRMLFLLVPTTVVAAWIFTNFVCNLILYTIRSVLKDFNFFFVTPFHFLSCYYCDMFVRKLTRVITRRGLGFSRALTGYNKL